jgi:PTH2 family peptidyl-tRNA hydrolase
MCETYCKFCNWVINIKRGDIMDKDLRMYILVNQDIKINKGKLAGQVGHAVATMFYNQWETVGKILPIMEEYMNNYQKKIILSCPQNKLEELEKEGYIAIRDKGWTDLESNTLTCVNLGIIDFNNIPKKVKFIKDLKLVR